MSKRLKNYPDPVEVVHKYGADALRLYLVNSPVVRAEPLRFKERGVKDALNHGRNTSFNTSFTPLSLNLRGSALTTGELTR